MDSEPGSESEYKNSVSKVPNLKLKLPPPAISGPETDRRCHTYPRDRIRAPCYQRDREKSREISAQIQKLYEGMEFLRAVETTSPRAKTFGDTRAAVQNTGLLLQRIDAMVQDQARFRRDIWNRMDILETMMKDTRKTTEFLKKRILSALEEEESTSDEEKS